MPLTREIQKVFHAGRWLASRHLGSRPQVLLRRAEAMGDTILVTGVLKHYVERHAADVFVDSQYFLLFDGFPGVVAGRYSKPFDGRGFDTVINLDMASEADRSRPIVELYARKMLGGYDPAADYSPRLYLKPTKLHDSWRGGAVIHAVGKNWPSRVLAAALYHRVERLLDSLGLRAIFIGGPEDYAPALPGSIDLRSKLSIRQLYTLLAGARIFVGFDSGPMHIASTTAVPIVAFFTVSAPANVVARPRGTYAVSSQAGCRYCAGWYRNVTFIPCAKGTPDCVDRFDWAQIEAAVHGALACAADRGGPA